MMSAFNSNLDSGAKLFGKTSNENIRPFFAELMLALHNDAETLPGFSETSERILLNPQLARHMTAMIGTKHVDNAFKTAFGFINMISEVCR